MYKTIQTVLAMAGIALGLAIAPAMAQSGSDTQMTMSTKADKDKMMALDKMSTEEKAAMSDADKMMATKMAGHDMSKMADHDRMAMTDKMPAEDKAMMYQKMATGKMMDKMDKAALDKAVMEKMKK
jgi:predicted membrane-bound mannosyltransferase